MYTILIGRTWQLRTLLDQLNPARRTIILPNSLHHWRVIILWIALNAYTVFTQTYEVVVKTSPSTMCPRKYHVHIRKLFQSNANLSRVRRFSLTKQFRLARLKGHTELMHWTVYCSIMIEGTLLFCMLNERISQSAFSSQGNSNTFCWRFRTWPGSPTSWETLIIRDVRGWFRASHKEKPRQ